MAPTMFSTYLKDRAATWFKSLTKETKDDFELIIGEFERVFITAGRNRRLNNWLSLRQIPVRKYQILSIDSTNFKWRLWTIQTSR